MISHRPATLVLALWMAATGGTARVVWCQSADQAVAFDDLGFTRPLAWGARDAALQTSALSISDVTAIMGNCAGLARLKRIHAALAFDRRSSRTDLAYSQTTNGSPIAATRLAFAGAAVPVPVLRGSLVPAIAVYRAFVSDLDLAYTRENTDDGRNEDFRAQQEGATYAFALGLGADLSPILSAGVSLFLLHGAVDTHRRYRWTPIVPVPMEETFVLEDISSDIDGYGAQLGVQIFPHRRLQMGLRFDAPLVVNVSSSRLHEETHQIDNDIGSFSRKTDVFARRYELPYRFTGAIAVPLTSLTLSLQVEYANWELAAVERRRIYTPDLDFVMGRSLSVAAGVEWVVPRRPVRLRAGYSHTPSPLKYLQADRIDNDEMVHVQSHSGRNCVAAGAAVLLSGRVALEAAWVRTTGARHTAVFSDATHETRVSLQGAYWF